MRLCLAIFSLASGLAFAGVAPGPVFGSGGAITTSSGGATLVFNYLSGFTDTSQFYTPANVATFSGQTLVLFPANVGHTASSVWYKTQQSTGPFTTKFIFQITPSVTTIPTTGGFTFCMQNTPQGSFGGYSFIADANADGYGYYAGQADLVNSFALKFDLWGYGWRTGTEPNSTGLFINSGNGPYGGLRPENDLNPEGINLYSGDTYEATITYDGSVITEVIQDQTSGAAAARYEWPLNAANSINGSTSWIGFTAGAVNLTSQINILGWEYWTGYLTRLSQPTFSPAGGQYASSRTVTIGCPSGATCYYTTNGLNPTTLSTVYTAPITVSANTDLKVVAVESNHTDSYVASAQYQIGTANVINFGSGFSANDGMIIAGSGQLNGSQIQLTDTSATTNSAMTGGEAGSAWWGSPVNVQTFTAAFTYQQTSNSGGGNSVGSVFVIQNSPPAFGSASTNASWGGGLGYVGVGGSGGSTGGTGPAYGYGENTNSSAGSPGMLSSVGIVLDSDNDAVNFVQNGANARSGETPITGGISLLNGDPIAITVTYNGTTVSLSMTDTINSDTFSTSWAANIPSIVGGNTAYVGFTGSTGAYGGYTVANQFINSFTYHN